MAPPTSTMVVVGGAPYSVTLTWEFTQNRPDGTQSHTKQPPDHLWRDALGRERRDVVIPEDEDGHGAVLAFEINDPVAGYSYILEPSRKIAHRFPLRQVDLPKNAGPHIFPPAFPMVPREARVSYENLGTKYVEGLECLVKRRTATLPAGYEGSDHPIVKVAEMCYSPYLNMSILTKLTDELGESLLRATNISLFDPDRTLFEVPADYRVVDGVGPVAIHVTAPSH